MSTHAKERPTCQRSAYAATLRDFLDADPNAVLGELAGAAEGDVSSAQMGAWKQQIDLLKIALPADTPGIICFEFVIPRIGKRADNVVLIGDRVAVLEFKIGATKYDADAKMQATDYAIDLKNFHCGSHNAFIVPVLVATKAPPAVTSWAQPSDGVFGLVLANAQTVASILRDIASHAQAHALSHSDWLVSGYRPTPNIVEASQAMYHGHSVADITYSEARSDNLGETTHAVETAIRLAREQNEKIICFISGVPGAGKTLAGMNIICNRRKNPTSDAEHGVFLSGNGPLVSVLQEALSRDDVARASARGVRISKTEAHRKAVGFIQNIHHFRDEYLKDANAPVERVVVFDEAQRAWNTAQTSDFMRKKRNQPDFDASEPEFLISVMNRHAGWAAIICLVGGGQEINTGEAGIEEWLRAVRDHHPHWHVHLPSQLESIDYLREFKVQDLPGRVTRSSALHLSVSLRSFRSERVSTAVSALLSSDAIRAKLEISPVLDVYPIVITRSLESAKHWLKSKARGSERFGLLASSGAKRIKTLGINMSLQIDPCHWFLNGSSDVRSSFSLEDAASEFDVQGLELDWAAVIWDGDLIYRPEGWHFRSFKGTRWQEVKGVDAQRYRLNAYRVLLTRARQGMVIVVPEGCHSDATRLPSFYDPTWEFLVSVGLSQCN
jgi:hypothetical protein